MILFKLWQIAILTVLAAVIGMVLLLLAGAIYLLLAGKGGGKGKR